MDRAGVGRIWPYPRVLAHRCGGWLAPENTLAGLERAARWVGGVEFDVMLSADGSPWVIHDETLERTTDGAGSVARTGDARIAQLDAGRWFDEAFAGERVPSLEEAARSCHVLGLAANVEIKPATGQDRETGRVVAEQVARLWRGAARPPLLSSFSLTALEAAREVAPELPRGVLVGAIPAHWVQLCRDQAAIALHADARFLTEHAVRAVRAAGLWCVAYTENDPERVSTLIEWGVNCVITDRPDVVNEESLRVRPVPAASSQRSP